MSVNSAGRLKSSLRPFQDKYPNLLRSVPSSDIAMARSEKIFTKLLLPKIGAQDEAWNVDVVGSIH